MFRRRRVQREIPFSFDSFLDVVANVVGIIVRLILVAWAGARTYKAFVPPLPAPDMPATTAAALPEPNDPLAAELEKQRRQLAEARARLVDRQQEYDRQRQDHTGGAWEVAELDARVAAVTAEQAALEEAARRHAEGERTAALSVQELRARTLKLCEEIDQLRKAPPLKKTLRYRTPVSQPVQSEEWMFECRRGRVTLIDIGTLLDEARRGLRDKTEELRSRWEVTDVTPAAGAFRLRYSVQRERTAWDLPGATPGAGAAMRCALTAWEAEPVDPNRGESAEAALAPTSEFRRVSDHLDPRQAAVTLWVYPDSFPLYRRLRDYLHEHDISVAGRPLPEGAAIAASREGSASRAQ
jgi:hypothetical protein